MASAIHLIWGEIGFMPIIGLAWNTNIQRQNVATFTPHPGHQLYASSRVKSALCQSQATPGTPIYKVGTYPHSLRIRRVRLAHSTWGSAVRPRYVIEGCAETAPESTIFPPQRRRRPPVHFGNVDFHCRMLCTRSSCATFSFCFILLKNHVAPLPTARPLPLKTFPLAFWLTLSVRTCPSTFRTNPTASSF